MKKPKMIPVDTVRASAPTVITDPPPIFSLSRRIGPFLLAIRLTKLQKSL